MKYEWRKAEKELYLPKTTPMYVEVPAFNFLTLKGQGDPNRTAFKEQIAALYSLAYAIRMKLKNQGFEYTVYSLEGLWTLPTAPIIPGQFDKADLQYQIMIRQPPQQATKMDLVEVLEKVRIKKPNQYLDQVNWETIADGAAVQILHVGPYDTESESFAKLDGFCKEHQLERKNHLHREIYLSDARRVVPEKRKTVLRYSV
nr:GyrI-like domain-containing protein [Lentilactobacillus senioris]